jgi:hypothetical protein
MSFEDTTLKTPQASHRQKSDRKIAARIPSTLKNSAAEIQKKIKSNKTSSKIYQTNQVPTSKATTQKNKNSFTATMQGNSI